MTGAPEVKTTVLVVDDEAPLRRVLERALSRLGYRVIGAGSAESALDLLATERPHAILLDIHLPTMSGLAFYVAAMARWPELEGCVAVMTGDGESTEVLEWIARNSCPLISKPFNLEQVEEWLNHVRAWRNRRAEQA
ncbi:MAG TPA: response regulator [Gemmatimonadales bacterium]|jgi:DNA-binding NtrC family response regulator|nr:response regulator [Gemmatimonadales bacterium]